MILAIFIVMSSLLLFGCGNDEENENDTPNQVEGNENTEQTNDQVNNDGNEENNAENNARNNEEETDDSGANVDTFIEEVTKINKELESYSIESIIDTVQTFDGEINHSTTTQEQDTIFEPFQYKKYMVTEQQDDSDYDDGGADDEEITMYNVDGTNYINFKGIYGDGKQWSKRENEFSDDDLRAAEMIDVEKILENLSEIIIDKTLTEEDEIYILSLDIDLEKLTELEIESPQVAQSDDEEATKKLKDTYKVEQMDYQMKFDKDSKFLLEMESARKYSYEMDFNDKTGKMETEEKTVVTYKNHNQVDEIKLPNEVLDNAVESSE